MAVLPLVIAPDPILKQKSVTVEAVDDSVRGILNDMLDTMYKAGGIGLAAIQVGIPRRLIVIDTEWRDEDAVSRRPLKIINAEIISHSDEAVPYNEGCLSFPDQFSEVNRPDAVKIGYLDETGARQELSAVGLLATCIQHEIDHMNGITFVDHISRLKRDMILKKLDKNKRMGVYDEHQHDEFCSH